MNRPEKLNALDPAMFEGLTKMGLELASNQSVRAVVLSGEGRAFCAGLDFTSFQAMADSNSERSALSLMEQDSSSPANYAQRAAYVWTELPVPVVADIRFVAPDARLSIMEINWGLVPDMSGTQTLRHLVRFDVVKELTFTGRVISGPEAVELGLATHVSEKPFDAAMALAQEIASNSPDAVRAGKKLLNASRLVSLEEGLRMEEEMQRTLIGRTNQVEAVQANIQKRDPNFKDPD
jgi:enoyl-CoA hydratase/carnithine racemase